MFNNKNIVKYCAKYFVLMAVGAYIFNASVTLINQKSDVANLVVCSTIHSLRISISSLPSCRMLCGTVNVVARKVLVMTV
jgi:hypothetical protein